MDEGAKRQIIANNCRNFRLEAGLSQEEVAFFAETGIDAVRAWEQGKRSPGRDSLERLAKLYGRSMDDFVTATPPPRPKKSEPLVATKIIGDEPPGLREELERVIKRYTHDSLIARTAKKEELKKGKKR